MAETLPIVVRQASMADIDIVTPLFDAYRQFYGKPPDHSIARRFLLERLERNESVIFVAQETGGAVVGFTQLYPSFSSEQAKPIFILNDLFVVAEGRRCGIGRLLLGAAADFGRRAGAACLTLATGVGNAPAQALYETAGWTRDREFYTYNLPL